MENYIARLTVWAFYKVPIPSYETKLSLLSLVTREFTTNQVVCSSFETSSWALILKTWQTTRNNNKNQNMNKCFEDYMAEHCDSLENVRKDVSTRINTAIKVAEH